MLQPGYRSEFLTVFPSAGQYCVIDKKTIAAASINAYKQTLQTPSDLQQGYKVYTRTRYERYIGGYVLHCHILDHEDNGMMQRVNVYLAGDSADPEVAKEGGHMGH